MNERSEENWNEEIYDDMVGEFLDALFKKHESFYEHRELFESISENRTHLLIAFACLKKSKNLIYGLKLFYQLAHNHEEPERSIILLTSEPSLRTAFEFVAYGTWALYEPYAFVRMVKKDLKFRKIFLNENPHIKDPFEGVYEDLEVEIDGVWQNINENVLNRFEIPNQTSMFDEITSNTKNNLYKRIYRYLSNEVVHPSIISLLEYMNTDLETFESKLDLESFDSMYRGLIISTVSLMNNLIAILEEQN